MEAKIDALLLEELRCGQDQCQEMKLITSPAHG